VNPEIAFTSRSPFKYTTFCVDSFTLLLDADCVYYRSPTPPFTLPAPLFLLFSPSHPFSLSQYFALLHARALSLSLARALCIPLSLTSLCILIWTSSIIWLPRFHNPPLSLSFLCTHAFFFFFLPCTSSTIRQCLSFFSSLFLTHISSFFLLSFLHIICHKVPPPPSLPPYPPTPPPPPPPPPTTTKTSSFER